MAPAPVPHLSERCLEKRGHKAKQAPRCLFSLDISGGVADGARTHDNQNHNLGLYQLSYSHHRKDTDYSLIF